MPIRMPPGSEFEKAPWYVRVFVQLGLPTTFALILLWFLVANIAKALDTVQDAQGELTKVNALIVENQKQVIDLLIQHSVEQRESLAVLMALCYNSARTDPERLRCADALRVKSK